MDIPRGYARVQVGRVEPKWEDMDLEVHGGDSETLLGHTIQTWICQALHKASASSCLITLVSRQRSPSLAAIGLLAVVRRLKCLQKNPPQQSAKNTSPDPPLPVKRKQSKQPVRQSPPKKKEKPPLKKLP
jgi:hypothetical protein